MVNWRFVFPYRRHVLLFFTNMQNRPLRSILPNFFNTNVHLLWWPLGKQQQRRGFILIYRPFVVHFLFQQELLMVTRDSKIQGCGPGWGWLGSGSNRKKRIQIRLAIKKKTDPDPTLEYSRTRIRNPARNYWRRNCEEWRPSFCFKNSVQLVQKHRRVSMSYFSLHRVSHKVLFLTSIIIHIYHL